MKNLICCFVLIFLFSIGRAQSGGEFEISQATIANGGNTSAGNVFVLESTTGQSTAGNPILGPPFAVTAGFWNFIPGPQFQFSGFLAPVDNLPMINTGKAGKIYPIKWQLRDANGAFVTSLSSFVSLLSSPIECEAAQADTLEEVSSPGGTTLIYDAEANQFVYNWKTSGSWRGCRLLQLTLSDGSTYYARFRF